jgi:hypothetical protein|tara:strand:+ start:6073 stop:8088 length:2016 start_codon:yes stop_codon:yes gene_type:complete
MTALKSIMTQALTKLKSYSSSLAKTTVTSDMSRILGMPIKQEIDIKSVEKEFIKAHAYESGFRLFKPQAEALELYITTGKLLGSIGVGWGKTLITLSIAQIAIKEKGLNKVVLMIPPTVYPQLMQRDITWARKRIRLTVPIIGLRGSAKDRLNKAQSDISGLYILPYSTMSTSNGEDCLRSISPDLIIADEVHNLKNLKSAKTRRTFHVIKDLDCDLVGLSGTITSKSIRDYRHILDCCLKENSPIPNSYQQFATWMQVMDSGMSPTKSQLEDISPLIKWADKHFPEEEFTFDSFGFRTAYRCRFESCPNVVSTGDADIHTSLTICNASKNDIKMVIDKEQMGELTKFIRKVKDDWKTPNDDEISYVLHKYKWLYELTAGFYNELIWPTIQEIQEDRRVSEKVAKEILIKSKMYHTADQEYHKEVRSFLKDGHRSGLDTPELIGTSIKNHQGAQVGPLLYTYWCDRRDADFEGRVERYTRSKRVCDYKIQCAYHWARILERGIIWYYNREIGIWLNEYLQEFNPLFCPSGDEHNEKIIDPSTKDRIVIASIMAHSTGKNLQFHQNQLFVQWPRVASRAEQTLGRLHRNEQKAEDLYVDLLLYTGFDFECFAATLQDSLYIHSSTGARQKLVYAHYDPFPETYPSDFLRERGFDVKRLDRKMKEEMDERFGQ